MEKNISKSKLQTSLKVSCKCCKADIEYWSSTTQSVVHRISLASLESTVATLSNKQLSTNCLFSVSILSGKDIDVSQFNRTYVKVFYKISFVFKIFTTRTTAVLFIVRVFKLMRSQFKCCTKTLWTFITNIRLYTIMTKYMVLKFTTLTEFLLTNVTRDPSTIIVWLQQMCLECVEMCKTVWTVSTWVWLCTSVSINMMLQITATFKPLSTVTTVMRSSVACTWLLCRCKLLDWLKLLSHSEHLYGLSPMWTLMWVVKFPDTLNALSHSGHLCGFSPLWILLCIARLNDCVNRLLQTVHSNDFSAKWLCLCTVKFWLVLKHFPHSVHLYLLLWTFICILK